MVKIDHIDIHQIAKNYFVGIKTLCQERISFFSKALNLLFGDGSVDDLTNDSLHGNSKKACLNFLLVQQKISKQTEFDKFIVNNVHQWVIQHSQILIDIVEFLNVEDNLKSILLIDPTSSYNKDFTLQQQFQINYNQHKDTIFKFINQVLDYDLFAKYAYGISSSLGINTCPYCNRIYINTVIDRNNNKIIRPTFDHFFPHSKHPFLALSFFNLIPSCYYCNSNLKTATSITPDTHLHPYLDSFDNACSFRIVIAGLYPNISDARNYSITLQPGIATNAAKYRKIFGNCLAEGNCNLFKIQEIYNSHTDIVGELVYKADRYSRGQSQALLKLFGLLETNKSEFYQFYFGNYYNDKDYNRRPMAKLTKDVLQQILPDFFNEKGV